MTVINNPTQGTNDVRTLKGHCSFRPTVQLDSANSPENKQVEKSRHNQSFVEDYTLEHSLSALHYTLIET